MGLLSPGQRWSALFSVAELAATFGEGVSDINLNAQPPAALMAGLQGAATDDDRQAG
jgi:signal recognition particle subunit SRP54